MDDFNYLAVPISIILGLGITQLLSGLGRWVENRTSVPAYAPTIVWIVTLLVMHVQTWWSMYGLRHHQDWTFFQFVVVLLQPTTLFLLTTAVVPSSASAARDLKSNYFAQRRWFFSLLKAGNKLKLINQSVLKFTRHYINDTTVRRLLYERWTTMRAIKPNLAFIKKLIRAHNLPVRLLYGQYDRIIRPERGEKFRRGIESFCTLHIIQTGHQVLQEKQVKEIIPLIES